MKILILGHRGMLGHMVKLYFEQLGYNVVVTEDRFPSVGFFKFINEFDGEYIVNAIGSIPQKTNEFSVNYNLPKWLIDNISVRTIHPGTDCEMDDDDYGVSKRNASFYIKSKPNNVKIMKCSIIGPELGNNKSLLGWFLNSEGSVRGYLNSYWNGITTLEWSKQCVGLINNWDTYDIENIIQSECVSKYKLLHIIKDVFKVNIKIIPFENEYINKCLSGNIQTVNIESQLIELKKFYYQL